MVASASSHRNDPKPTAMHLDNVEAKRTALLQYAGQMSFKPFLYGAKKASLFLLTFVFLLADRMGNQELKQDLRVS
jgi:hypothetical protein